MLVSGTSGGTPMTEAVKLARLYRGDALPAPPRAGHLRHPRLMDILLAGLFSPTPKLRPDAKEAYLTLLAFAAAAIDER
jgi:TH1 protein